MVTAERDDPRMVLAVSRDGHEWLPGQGVVPQGRKRGAMEKLLVTVFDLLDGVLVVVRGHWDVTAVDNLETREERVYGKRYVVATVERQATRACADPSRTEPGARAVRCAGVLALPLVSLNGSNPPRHGLRKALR